MWTRVSPWLTAKHAFVFSISDALVELVATRCRSAEVGRCRLNLSNPC